MSVEQEMTLDEYLALLPPSHIAKVELAQIREQRDKVEVRRAAWEEAANIAWRLGIHTQDSPVRRDAVIAIEKAHALDESDKA